MRYAFVVLLLIAALCPAEPHYVDLSKIATTSLENDGSTGWANEGINDMFTYPPIPSGEVTRNGYRFSLPKPASITDKTVVMLKGHGLPNLPADATAAVPNVKGKYVYFLQNSVKKPAGQPANYRVATYTVTYADSSTAEIALHDGQEIRGWYTGSWYENSGSKAWPIFMGRNVISSKWNQLVGVWAMQWPNPSPDKPITSITFKSEGFASPAIFAVTIDDADYFTSPDVKADYKRPADVPADYFAPKLAGEQKKLFELMRKQDLVKGMRSVELIRPDLLAVTIDTAVAQGAGMGGANAAALQNPENFAVAGQAPVKVGRHSYEYWNGDIGPFAQNAYYWHTYYLQLASPLQSGKSVDVSVKGLPEGLTSSMKFDYDEKQTVTPAIKINQVAYSPLGKQRYAYVGWWAGDSGPVDYASCKTFQVVNDRGEVPLAGDFTARKADPLSGEDVLTIDLSSLKPGKYHILVPGLGRSDAFTVGSAQQLYVDTNRAFYHQRCGLAFAEPFTTFKKDACHTEVYESGHLVGGNYTPKPGEAIRQFSGGYHDAADFDCFTYHLRATAQVLAVFEQLRDRFKDGDLNIPESGNQIPDVLDEADWALFSYRDTQQPDGGVPLGRGNDEDAIRDWEREHKGRRPPFGLFPPTPTSCTEYAAVAAQFARLIKPLDAVKSAKYVESAKKAFAWAQQQKDQGKPEMGGNLFLMWAAAELYSTTGEESYNDAFKRGWAAGWGKDVHWKLFPVASICQWPYLVTQQAGADKSIQDELRKLLLGRADETVKLTAEPPYRVGRGPADKGNGWGNLNGGGFYADRCLRAYFLTKDQKYLDAACLNADFQLGCNPLGKTFISGEGVRPPRHPQISAFLYTGPGKTGSTVKGITVYGLTSDQPKWYPADIPSWRRWRDLGNGGAEISSEFTITETIGNTAMLYAALHALESP